MAERTDDTITVTGEAVVSPAWRRTGGHTLAGMSRTVAAEEIGIHANLELGASVTITYGIER